MKMKRVFLKSSGEALAGPKRTEFGEDTMEEVARQVKLSVDMDIQVEIVIDGGNFQRGRISEAIDRTKVDQIGILATAMNCIYISEIFRNANMITQILASFACNPMTKLFSKDRTNKYFERGMAVSFAGGTGYPYSFVDAGIVLRATEMKADCILSTKAIDGVYGSDPKLNPEAKKYDTISIQEATDKQLAMVGSAVSIMRMEHKMPMVVSNLNKKNGIADTVQGRINGTIVTT